jgi:hypothetical protein
MHLRKGQPMLKIRWIFRNSFIAVLVLSIFICSFTTGIIRQDVAGTPFRTVPPVNATFATPIGALTPVPTPLPTLGPGQYFAEGDEYPRLGISYGNDLFGWGYILEDTSLALVWMTDGDGTHYLIVEATNEWLLGTIDEETDVRGENGFDDFITQMEERIDEFYDDVGEGIASAVVFNVLVAGIALCPETAGVGCILGVLGAAAVALGTGISKLVKMIKFEFDISDIYTNIRGSFEMLKVESTK